MENELGMGTELEVVEVVRGDGLVKGLGREYDIRDGARGWDFA